MRNNKRTKELSEKNFSQNNTSTSTNSSSNSSANTTSRVNVTVESNLNSTVNTTVVATTSNNLTNPNNSTLTLTTNTNTNTSPSDSNQTKHKRNLKQEFIEQAVEAGSALAHNLFPEQVIDDLDVQEQKVLEQAQQVQQAVRQNLNASKASKAHATTSPKVSNSPTVTPNLLAQMNLTSSTGQTMPSTTANQPLAPVYPVNYSGVVPDSGSTLFGDIFLGNYKSFEHLKTNQNSILINSLERAIDSCSKHLKNNMFVICGSDHAFVPQIMHTCVEFGDECGLEANDILFVDMHDLIDRIPIDEASHAQIKLPIKPLIILTNIQLAIGNNLWEKVLINLINQIYQANTTLITSSKQSLDSLSFYYKDLASRFTRFQIYVLQPESKDLIREYILSYSEQINLKLAKRTFDLLVDMIYQDANIEIESTLECLLVLCLNLNIATNKLTCNQLREHASEFILYEMIDW